MTISNYRRSRRILQKPISLLLILCCFTAVYAQPMADSIQVPPELLTTEFDQVVHPRFLDGFTQKLKKLARTNEGQVTIVHIGDSHVQGYYFPTAVRKTLQDSLGNAGRGFVFPYRVAGSNGAQDVRFKTTGRWNGVRNVKSRGRDDVGISGFALSTAERFLMQVSLDPEDSLRPDRVRILSPRADDLKISISDEELSFKHTVTRYRIRQGDFLGKIASKFGVTTAALRRANNLRGDRIYAGKTLKIPSQEKVAELIDNTNFTDLPKVKGDVPVYALPDSVDHFFIRPAGQSKKYALDGLILENDGPGVRYHGIGVNGAKFSDYTMYDRFFVQLAQLKPDLVIVSLGTNETFFSPYSEDKMDSDLLDFYKQLESHGITAPVLVTTPPPSLKKRYLANQEATAYSYRIRQFANLHSWALYDLHGVMGESRNMKKWFANGLASYDRIHYNRKGYTVQGMLLARAILRLIDKDD